MIETNQSFVPEADCIKNLQSCFPISLLNNRIPERVCSIRKQKDRICSKMQHALNKRRMK